MLRRRAIPLVMGLMMLTGCTGHSDTLTRTDPAGWTVELPSSWHEVRFDSSDGDVRATGVQFSNVPVSAPSKRAGYPVATNQRVLPGDGISLIVAQDDDLSIPRHQPIPLPFHYPDGWTQGSAVFPDEPLYSFGVVMDGHQRFVLNLAVGAHASTADRQRLTELIDSFRFGS